MGGIPFHLFARYIGGAPRFSHHPLSFQDNQSAPNPLRPESQSTSSLRAAGLQGFDHGQGRAPKRNSLTLPSSTCLLQCMHGMVRTQQQRKSKLYAPWSQVVPVRTDNGTRRCNAFVSCLHTSGALLKQSGRTIP
jgi:hypothetical protein